MEATLLLELGFKSQEEVELEPRQTQPAPLEHPQVLEQCFKEPMEPQEALALELVAPVLRQQVLGVAQVEGCQLQQLLDLLAAMAEPLLDLG